MGAEAEAEADDRGGLGDLGTFWTAEGAPTCSRPDLPDPQICAQGFSACSLHPDPYRRHPWPPPTKRMNNNKVKQPARRMGVVLPLALLKTTADTLAEVCDSKKALRTSVQ